MEDVLDLYADDYDEKRPVVGFDETSKQLIAETRQPVPARAGAVERFDYEYRRGGVCNLFMFCQPKRGWRHVEVTERRTMPDFARQMKWLVDEAFPFAERVRVVMDNLNTHKPASLYETFAPEEARRILRKLEFHYTPKHGSWLNIAENELSSMTRQCVTGRRIGDIQRLGAETSAWASDVNETQRGVDWQMKIDDARSKLISVYPKIKL